MTDQEKTNFEETLKHIESVQQKMYRMVGELLQRSYVHDKSKLSEKEAPFFAENVPKLKGLTYGSEEYKKALKDLKPALDHHYKMNSHHPEHYENGINGMCLIDVLEMFCDWWAATERHEDGNLWRSIEINKDRFKMSDQLYDIFHATYMKYVSPWKKLK